MVYFLHSLYFILAIFLVISQSKQDKPFFTSLESLCHNTFHSKTTCDSISPLIDTKKTYNSQFLYNISLQLSINEVSRVVKNFSENGVLARMLQDTKEEILLSALESCRDFLSLALYNLRLSLPIEENVVTHETRTNFRTWLSAAGADLQTCIHDLEYAPEEIKKTVATNLDKSTQLITTSLAVISKIDDYMSLHEETLIKLTSNWNPTWMSLKQREMLQNPKQTMKPDAVVAADGSGNYKTITEAIKAVPANSSKRFAIYVKKGVYNENIKIGVEKWNVMMYGDGMDKTVISSSRSNSTGSSTSMTATFAVFGTGFIARDMGFKNNAGPESGQAVALLSASDQSVFYRCLVDSYQDTLCTQSNRQFYRECNISGTIDFIFGDSSVVIQNCYILVKKQVSFHAIITAQGRSNPYANTGISIQNCSILPAENSTGVEAFLGRPWGDYSTTIYLESRLGSLVDPKGWQPWNRTTPVPRTISYIEYNNVGPGALTTERVQWVRVNNTRDAANNFTVTSFIDGLQWLPATGVPFQPAL